MMIDDIPYIECRRHEPLSVVYRNTWYIPEVPDHLLPAAELVVGI